MAQMISYEINQDLYTKGPQWGEVAWLFTQSETAFERKAWATNMSYSFALKKRKKISWLTLQHIKKENAENNGEALLENKCLEK